MPQFFVHLGRAGDGLRNLLAEKLMIAAAHPFPFARLALATTPLALFLFPNVHPR